MEATSPTKDPRITLQGAPYVPREALRMYPSKLGEFLELLLQNKVIIDQVDAGKENFVNLDSTWTIPLESVESLVDPLQGMAVPKAEFQFLYDSDKKTLFFRYTPPPNPLAVAIKTLEVIDEVRCIHKVKVSVGLLAPKSDPPVPPLVTVRDFDVGFGSAVLASHMATLLKKDKEGTVECIAKTIYSTMPDTLLARTTIYLSYNVTPEGVMVWKWWASDMINPMKKRLQAEAALQPIPEGKAAKICIEVEPVPTSRYEAAPVSRYAVKKQ